VLARRIVVIPRPMEGQREGMALTFAIRAEIEAYHRYWQRVE